MDRRVETGIVKAALKAHAINAKISHGRGTAWAWLEINIGAGQDFGDHDKHEQGEHILHPRWCRRCKIMREIGDLALKIAQNVTGRRGEYSGKIIILTQDHWNDAKRMSEPIAQPWWPKGTITKGGGCVDAP